MNAKPQDVHRALDLIHAFNRDCVEAEYTDTGDVWDLLEEVCRLLGRPLPEQVESDEAP